MKYFPLFLLFLAISCAAPNGAYVFYDEPAYAEKERRLPINTEQAATLFARNYFEQHPSAEKVTAYILSPLMRYVIELSMVDIF